MKAWLWIIASLLLAGHIAAARGELVLFERFDYPDGALQGNGRAEIDGWREPWDSDGFQVQGGVMQGRGEARRRMIARVDFEQECEWFFRVTLQRRGTSSTREGSDYCLFRMLNSDDAVNRAPLFAGIDSSNHFYAGAGITTQQAGRFGDADPDKAYTFVARLKTHTDGKDELDVWVFAADQPLPAQPPAKPDLVQYCDYSGDSDYLGVITGNAEGYAARVDDIVIGGSWQDVAAASFQSFKHPDAYRKMRPVMVQEHGTHLLPNLWGSMSVIQWDDDRWQLFFSSQLRWLPRQRVLYSPVDDDVRRQAKPEPDPAIPLFDAGREFSQLPDASYQMIERPGGGYDLIDRDKLTYLPLGDKPYDIKRAQAASYALLKQKIAGESTRFIADADGDGVPDLLIGQCLDNKYDYFPDKLALYQQPRRRPPDSIMGPDSDPVVNQSMRGYDVVGNWVGSTLTHHLLWARGTRVDGRLRFGEIKPIYKGRDDFPARWINHTRNLCLGLITRSDQRYLVMLSATDQVLAAPLLDTDDGNLHIGVAMPLLAPDEQPYTLNLDRIHGIVDLDGDGRKEIIIGGGGSGYVSVLRGEAVGSFRVHPVQMVGGPVAAGTLIVPTCGDWDNDGRMDLILGDGQGLFTLFPGTDDPLVYRCGLLLRNPSGQVIKHWGEPNLQGPQERGWSYTQTTLFDWDHDGQLDLISNDNTATFRLYRRIDAADPTRVDDGPVFTMNGAKLPVAWRMRPGVIDGKYAVAGDDRPVLLYLDVDQLLTFAVPEKVGSTVIERTWHATYTDGDTMHMAWWSGNSGRLKFTVVDWDQDGTWDVLLDAQANNAALFYRNPQYLRHWRYNSTRSPFWLRNAGTNAEPRFERARRIRHADGMVIQLENHACNVCPADLDGDGEALDLFVGDGPGMLYYLMRDELSWDQDPSP